MDPLKYGIFIMPFHSPEKPPAQCYDEDLELVALADELGFHEFWIGEHHTMKYENIVMPEIFIGRALGETKHIRMGPAPRGPRNPAVPNARRLPNRRSSAAPPSVRSCSVSARVPGSGSTSSQRRATSSARRVGRVVVTAASAHRAAGPACVGLRRRPP